MRSTGVVVIDEHLDHALKMLLVQDQELVQTFGPHSPHKPLRDPVRLRSLNRRPNHVLAFKHGVEAARELGIAVANQEPRRLLPLE